MTTTAELNTWLNPKRIARPELKVGATVRVHQKIKEGDKERIQIFEGMIIKITGHQPDINITVRRVAGGIGVEKIIPVMSANVDKIDIVKHAKIRRAKLYYVRDLRGKAARFKEVYLTDEERKKLMEDQIEITDEVPAGVEVEKAEAPVEEEVVEEKAEEVTEEKTEEIAKEEAPVEEVKPEEEEKKEEKAE